eukprot:1488858-Rhodomonas_salina.2
MGVVLPWRSRGRPPVQACACGCCALGLTRRRCARPARVRLGPPAPTVRSRVGRRSAVRVCLSGQRHAACVGQDLAGFSRCVRFVAVVACGLRDLRDPSAASARDAVAESRDLPQV